MAAAFLPEVTESQLSGTAIGGSKPQVVRVPFSIRRQRSPGPSPLGQGPRAGQVPPSPLQHEPPVTFRGECRQIGAKNEEAEPGFWEEELDLLEERNPKDAPLQVADADLQYDPEAQQENLDFVNENDSLLRSESDKRHQAVKHDRGAVLVWKDLTIAIGGKKSQLNKVVQGLTGYALPGKLLAIMGPPRCGKTTLLKALAGISPSYARIYGEIVLNGRPQFIPAGSYVYVQKEEEAVIETLTIREALHYAALMRFPDCSMSCVEKSSLVEAAIVETSLTAYATSRLSSLSLAEKKRLSIAVQLLTNPKLVFLDEPNYDLDSVAGLMLMATLKNLATEGRTVLVTLQQASSEAFTILDNLLLLSYGRTIYFGEALGALEHFEIAGFPCPPLRSPADHFLRCINPEFEKAVMSLRLEQVQQDYEQGDMFQERLDSSVVIRTLEATYQASIDASTVLSLVLDLAEQERPGLEGSPSAGGMIRVGVLTWRSYLNMTRDFKYYWLRLIVFCLLMVSIGTVFYHADQQSNSVRATVSAIFLCVTLLSLLACGGFPALLKDLEVYWQERERGQTGPLIFTLGNLLSSIPFLFLLSSICSGIVYFLIGLRPAFSLFMYFILTIFLCLTIVEGLLMLVASIVPKVMKGLLLVALLQVLFILVAGYFQLSDDLTKPLWRYPTSYVSFHTYAVGGLLQNEFSDPAVLQGTFQLGYSNQHGKWVSLLILAGIGVGYRLTLLVSLILVEFFRSVVGVIKAMRKADLSMCLS